MAWRDYANEVSIWALSWETGKPSRQTLFPNGLADREGRLPEAATVYVQAMGRAHMRAAHEVYSILVSMGYVHCLLCNPLEGNHAEASLGPHP